MLPHVGLHEFGNQKFAVNGTRDPPPVVRPAGRSVFHGAMHKSEALAHLAVRGLADSATSMTDAWFTRSPSL